MKQARVSLLVMGLTFAALQPASAESWRDKVAAFAEKYLKHELFWSHSKRDYVLAKQLAATNHVALDEDVIFAAAWLHDMGTVPPFEEPKKDHADVGAAKIDIALAGTDFPKAKLEAVRAAILTHNPDRAPVSPEARYLHDADILDNLGASGWAWALELVDKNGGKPTGAQMAGNFKNTALFEKGVITPAGKIELVRRVREQKAFFDALSRETDGFKNL